MSKLTNVSYEPVLSDEFTVLLAPLRTSIQNVQFDEALADVAASRFRRTVRKFRASGAESTRSEEPNQPSPLSAAVGTGSIAGYRLLLRSPDEPENQPAWYSRFPKS
jgi:hypothetical protein